MQKFSKWNKGYRYLLMVIDVFSKFGWIVPLKDKTGKTVANAFKKIFKEKRIPKFLWTDKGKEFYNKKTKSLLDQHNIKLYSTENEEKSSVVERWNRTIKNKMWKQFTKQSSTQYLDMLPEIVLLFFFFLHCPLFREGCGGSSSRLSRHTSRSSITSIISLGRSPKRFHPRSSM